jgi:hypothetical protein
MSKFIRKKAKKHILLISIMDQFYIKVFEETRVLIKKKKKKKRTLLLHTYILKFIKNIVRSQIIFIFFFL